MPCWKSLTLCILYLSGGYGTVLRTTGRQEDDGSQSCQKWFMLTMLSVLSAINQGICYSYAPISSIVEDRWEQRVSFVFSLDSSELNVQLTIYLFLVVSLCVASIGAPHHYLLHLVHPVLLRRVVDHGPQRTAVRSSARRVLTSRWCGFALLCLLLWHTG